MKKATSRNGGRLLEVHTELGLVSTKWYSDKKIPAEVRVPGKILSSGINWLWIECSVLPHQIVEANLRGIQTFPNILTKDQSKDKYDGVKHILF